MCLIHELKRRNVLRIAAAYVVTAWPVIQVIDSGPLRLFEPIQEQGRPGA